MMQQLNKCQSEANAFVHTHTHSAWEGKPNNLFFKSEFKQTKIKLL